MTRQLILGAIPDDFDPSRHLPLGAWCFVGREQVYPAWEGLPFFDAFPDTGRLMETSAAVADLYDHLVPVWAARLNAEHGIDRPLSWWRLVLISWLYRLIEVACFRWFHVEQLVTRYGGEALVVEAPASDTTWPFASFEDFIDRGVRGTSFDAWLSGMVLRRLAPAHWSLVEVPAEPVPAKPAQMRVPPPGGLKGVVRKLLGRMQCQNTAGLSPRAKLLFSLYLLLLPRKAPRRVDFVPPARPPALLPPAFVELVAELAERTIPATLTTDFARFDAEARAQRYRPGRVFLSTTTSTNDLDVLVAANAEAKGERIVPSQYGCNYGTSLVYHYAQRLHYRHDAYFTYGWTEQEDYEGRFFGLPSPQLSPHVEAHRQASDEILLVGTTTLLRHQRFLSLPQAAQWVDYRKQKRAFLQSLAPDILAALVYRPYLHSSADLADLDYVRSFLPQARVAEGPLNPRLLACRLLVMDHPGTTLNIAMAADVPTVAFWDPQAWPTCRQATVVYDRLRAVGILHDDPVSAARQVEAVAGDVEAWWRSGDVQAARRQWCALYGRASRWWWLHWMAALARV